MAIPIPIPPADVAAPITVVVITRNRRDEASAAVSRLLALPDRPAVVVLDNGSTDGTTEALRRDHGATSRLRILPLGRNLGAAARNLGVAAATTRFVAFCDDDSGWRPGSLDAAATLLRDHPRLALIAARLEIEPGGRVDPVSIEMTTSPLPIEPDVPGRPVLGFLACAAIVSRRAFLAVGGFDPVLGLGGEEEPLALELDEAGKVCSHVEDIVAFHRPSPIRDPDARRGTVARNRLRLAWSRRRGRACWTETVTVLRSAVRDRPTFRGALDAIVDAPGILRRRRPLPWVVENRRRLLDQPAAG